MVGDTTGRDVPRNQFQDCDGISESKLTVGDTTKRDVPRNQFQDCTAISTL